jgi:ADP-heptose:LPS heptosyltransferase
MNVKTLQQIDRQLGVPLCWALTRLRKLWRRGEGEHVTCPRRILLVKLAEQGSTVLAYGAIRQAVEMVGRENVHFLVFEENRFILDLLDLIPRENVITVSIRSASAFVVSLARALRELRRRKIDAAVDMEFFSRGSAVLSFLSGARTRVGFHAFDEAGPYRGDLLTHRLIYNPHRHTSESFSDLVHALLSPPASLPTFASGGERVNRTPPLLRLSSAETELMREMLASAAPAYEQLILLNPNASDLLPLRRWPAARYVELAQRLLLRFPEAVVAFTGAPTEAKAGELLVAAVGSDRCVSLAGRTTLRQLLVLYSLADLLVTNDSGPAHFATLTPINVVTLFGPETPELFSARSPRQTVLWAQLPCSPCVSAYNNRISPCRDNQCMQAITVENVLNAAIRALQTRRLKTLEVACA